MFQRFLKHLNSIETFGYVDRFLTDDNLNSAVSYFLVLPVSTLLCPCACPSVRPSTCLFVCFLACSLISLSLSVSPYHHSYATSSKVSLSAPSRRHAFQQQVFLCVGVSAQSLLYRLLPAIGLCMLGCFTQSKMGKQLPSSLYPLLSPTLFASLP